MGRHSLSVSPADKINSKCAVGIAWQVRFCIPIPRSVPKGQTGSFGLHGQSRDLTVSASRAPGPPTAIWSRLCNRRTGLTVSWTLRYLTRVCEVSMYLDLIYSDKSCKLMQRETFPLHPSRESRVGMLNGDIKPLLSLTAVVQSPTCR